MTGTWKVRACSGVRVIVVVWESVIIYEEMTDDGHLDGASMSQRKYYVMLQIESRSISYSEAVIRIGE